MKIGASIMLAYDGTYIDFLNFAVAMQLDWVEFKYDPPFMLENHLRQISPAEIRRIGQEYGIGFSVHAPYYETNLGSLNYYIQQSSISSCCEAATLAAAMGCSYLTIHCGDLSKRFAADESLADLTYRRTLKSLEVINDHCRRLGIELAVENRNGSSKGKQKVGILPQELLDIRAKLGNTVGFTLDIGHANVSGVSAAQFVLQLGEHIRLMHVHDNCGLSDEHKAVGDGTIDFPLILQLYQENNWSFPWVVECKTLEDTKTSIQRLKALREASS